MSMTMSRVVRTLAVAAAAGLAAVASLTVASPAQAASGDHCAINLSEPGTMRCFETFEDAKRFAESLGERFGPGKGEAALSPGAARTDARAAVALVLYGIEYDWTLWNPGGGSRWVYGFGACTTPTTNVDGEISDWGVYGFDQRISSFQTFNNCWAKHYDLVGFGGLAVGYQGSQLIINAALNNDTSSERWS
ncbi:hypothetical protein [Plantactinospora sp. GCM10030261]|uniref:hypothetical protein n=1 Tax=Plantactinospora sp. GCM10030261 TaxID=3273420 RepID=UPI00360AB4E2